METYVPIDDFNWADNDMILQHITCKNHTTARYLSKHPYDRSLHFVESAVDMPPFTECSCPFGDLVVVVQPMKSDIRQRLADEMDSMILD